MLFPPPVPADWIRTEINGQQVCVDWPRQFNTHYISKSYAAAICSALTRLDAEAQPASGLPVSFSVDFGGTIGRLDYNLRGSIPTSSNDPYSDDDADQDEALYPLFAFDADYIGLPTIRTQRADSTTVGATTVIQFTLNTRANICAVLDDTLVGNEPPWFASMGFVDQGDNFQMLESNPEILGSRYCTTTPLIGQVQLGGNCNFACGSAEMYQVVIWPDWLALDFGHPTTPTVPVPGSIAFSPSQIDTAESTSGIQFCAERSGGDDGAATATIAEGDNAGSIVLNTTLLSWADQEQGSKCGTVDASSVVADLTATLTMTVTVAGQGSPATLPINITNTTVACGNNGCGRFTFATATMDEGTTALDKARHVRDQSNTALSAAATVEVYDTGTGTCPGSALTFVGYTNTSWAAGEEGNKHVTLTAGSVSSTCTEVLGLRNFSNLTPDAIQQTKEITIVDVAAPPTTGYYIDDTGCSNSYNGLFATFTSGSNGPWCTISKANSTLVAGDTVNIRSGTYEETLQPVNSGTAAAKITYKAYPSETATITGGGANGTPVAVINTNYVVLDGLHFWQDDPLTCGYPCYQNTVELNGNFNQVTNSFIENSRGLSGGNQIVDDWANGVWLTGIQVEGDDNTVDNNRIQGVVWGVKTGAQVDRTTIHDNNIGPIFQDAINVREKSGGGSQALLAEDNLLHDSMYSDGFQTNSGNQGATDVCGFVVRGNTLYNNAENGIDLKNACNGVIEDNVLYGNKGDNDGTISPNGSAIGPIECMNGSVECGSDTSGGSAVNLGSGTPSTNIIFRRNRIYDNVGGIGRHQSTWYVYNNTIVNNRRNYLGPNTVTGYGGEWDIGNGGPGRNNIIADNTYEIIQIVPSSWDYNLYSNCFQTPRFSWLGDARSGIWYTFTQWREDPYVQGVSGGSSGDNNSSVADPLFVNAPCNFTKDTPSLSFALQAGSPARNTGQGLTTTSGGGSGTVITLADNHWFTDGRGIVTGDQIRIGSSSTTLTIGTIAGGNQISVTPSTTWSSGQQVYLYPFYGPAPDKGAIEYVE